MNPIFLSLQGSYKQLQIALFHGITCIDIVLEESSRASAMLIPHIQNILKKHLFVLILLSFVAIAQVSQGQVGPPPPPPPDGKGTGINQGPGGGTGVPLDSTALVLLLGAAAFIGSRKAKPTHTS